MSHPAYIYPAFSHMECEVSRLSPSQTVTPPLSRPTSPQQMAARGETAETADHVAAVLRGDEVAVRVWLEGGGICRTQDDCEQRAKGSLGSSTKYPATMAAPREMLSSDPELNPDLHTWNRAFARS